jgi:hypothetical protein
MNAFSCWNLRQRYLTGVGILFNYCKRWRCVSLKGSYGMGTGKNRLKSGRLCLSIVTTFTDLSR